MSNIALYGSIVESEIEEIARRIARDQHCSIAKARERALALTCVEGPEGELTQVLGPEDLYPKDYELDTAARDATG